MTVAVCSLATTSSKFSNRIDSSELKACGPRGYMPYFVCCFYLKGVQWYSRPTLINQSTVVAPMVVGSAAASGEGST